jgi:hypothetical protein
LNVGSTLTLTNDCFSSNAAIGSNSHNSFGGVAITSRSGATLTITDCTLVGNQALGGTGSFGEGGSQTFSNCRRVPVRMAVTRAGLAPRYRSD